MGNPPLDTTWEGAPVSVISASDLVALKRASARPQDPLDVESLEALTKL